MPTSAAVVNFPFRIFPGPVPQTTSPMSGRQSAYNRPEPAMEDITAGVGAVVRTVSVAAVPGIMEPGADRACRGQRGRRLHRTGETVVVEPA